MLHRIKYEVYENIRHEDLSGWKLLTSFQIFSHKSLYSSLLQLWNPYT